MAVNKKISELTTLTTPTGVEASTFIPVAKSGANYKVNVQDLTKGLAYASPTVHPTAILTGDEQVPMTATGSDASAASRMPSSALLYAVNYLDNPAFAVAQQGSSFTGLAGGSVAQFWLDRWTTLQGGADTHYLVRVLDATGSIPGWTSFKVGRTAAAVTVDPLHFYQSMETVNVANLWNRTCTLSFYAKKGANYSATGNVLQTVINSGTGADGSWNGAFAGNAVVSSKDHTLTTSWQRFSHTFTLTAPLSLAPVFKYTPTAGAAGADDFFQLACIQLEIGEYATPFEARTRALELAACQRYWESNISYGALPAAGLACVNHQQSQNFAANQARVMQSFKVSKRTAAFTMTYYRGASAAGAGGVNAYPIGGPFANYTIAATAASHNECQADATPTGASGTFFLLEYHWVASAVL